jgi:hypothetical protein
MESVRVVFTESQVRSALRGSNSRVTALLEGLKVESG